MSTVIMVGAPALIITGTEGTDIIVTNDRTSATSSGWRTSGTTMSARIRSGPAPTLRAASISERSSEAMAPATISVTNGVCFHTKATTTPRQSRKLWLCSGVRRPSSISAWFMSPFLARNERMIWPATMNGMKSGQR